MECLGLLLLRAPLLLPLSGVIAMRDCPTVDPCPAASCGYARGTDGSPLLDGTDLQRLNKVVFVGSSARVWCGWLRARREGALMEGEEA